LIFLYAFTHDHQMEGHALSNPAELAHYKSGRFSVSRTIVKMAVKGLGKVDQKYDGM